MVRTDVLQFMPEDGGVILIIGAAHHHVPAPAEGGNVAFHQRQAAVLARLRDAAADDTARPRQGKGAEHQDRGCADGVKHGNPGEWGGGGLCHVHHFQFAHLDGDGLQQDYRPQAQQRQQVADHRAEQQRDPVEAEEGRAAHHQQEEGVEDGQIQAGARDIE